MKFGLDISQHQLDYDEILTRARLAEEAGFDGAWVFDHFKPLYGDPSGPCLEGWSLLAALARDTERLRLGALVTGVTYRHPSVLAAQAVTVDHLSGGRLELGLGAAWFEQEHRELGIDFPGAAERAARLEEAAIVLKKLMTEDGANFAGRHYRLNGARYNPKPLQRPHPPLWIGANGERRTLPIAGRLADVWHGSGSVASLARKAGIVREAARAAGRDPDEVTLASWLSISEPFEEVTERARALQDLGFGYLVVSWPSEGRARLEAFISEVMPALSS
jgi:F420-dependent oxidoreductase-like protein